MPSIKAVMDYSNMSYHEALALECDVFKLMYKHAYIDAQMQSEEGREYLKKCARLKCTDIDTEGLRKHFGKKGGN